MGCSSSAISCTLRSLASRSSPAMWKARRVGTPRPEDSAMTMLVGVLLQEQHHRVQQARIGGFGVIPFLRAQVVEDRHQVGLEDHLAPADLIGKVNPFIQLASGSRSPPPGWPGRPRVAHRRLCRNPWQRNKILGVIQLPGVSNDNRALHRRLFFSCGLHLNRLHRAGNFTERAADAVFGIL